MQTQFWRPLRRRLVTAGSAGLGRIALTGADRLVDLYDMGQANAMLDSITARLCAEDTTADPALVERAVVASWWMFERESDDAARARATEWYARAALAASAESEPGEPT